MRVVFMGTPPFAATVLERLAAHHEVCGVYCQPDRPAGRGHRLTPPAVKVLAQSLGLPVFQPLNFKDAADIETLRALQPDVLAVAAYGLILPQAVLNIPVHGPWNVHASLLPRYRGAAPIERAIISGDPHTGVTIMRMEAGLDTGPMALQRAMGIGIQDTAADLLPQLAELGASMLLEVLESAGSGGPVLIAQQPDRATYAAKLCREDGVVDWNRPVRAVHAQVRGVTPRPGARTVLPVEGGLEVILSAGIASGIASGIGSATAGGSVCEVPSGVAPGTVLPLQLFGDVLALPIVCADGVYGITELRPANRKAMSAEAFVNGYAPQWRRA